jgi:hypothetical protein
MEGAETGIVDKAKGRGEDAPSDARRSFERAVVKTNSLPGQPLCAAACHPVEPSGSAVSWHVDGAVEESRQACAAQRAAHIGAITRAMANTIASSAPGVKCIFDRI